MTIRCERLAARCLTVALACGLAACAGDYSGETEPMPPAAGGGESGGDHFAAQVQPRLDYCRTCHVPGGVADTDEGRRLLLAPSGAGDRDRIHAAWVAMGEGVEGHPLLTEPGDPAEPHSGGKPWPAGSAGHVAMRTLLDCFEAGTDCISTGEPTPHESLPLLGSKRAAHVWEEFCADQPDDAVLPPDPRSQIVAGANAGRAVFFNAYWEDCHVNAPASEQAPTTCGQYRSRRDRGYHFLTEELPMPAMSAAEFNNSWQAWGLDARPDDFDALYALRYGLNPAPFDNPYPLPGEDPNATGGGSGQLPLGLRQLKDGTGNWTGEIGTAACFLCHGGELGSPDAEGASLGLASLGLGNNNYDPIMIGRDGMPWAQAEYVADVLPPLDVNTLFNIGIKQRGQNNAVGAFEFLNTVLDLDSLGLNPDPLKFVTPYGVQGVVDTSHPLAHTQDTPPWWNMSVRPRKFFDAGVSNDSTRIIMAAGPGEFGELFSQSGEPYRTRIEAWDQDLEAFFLSRQSPPWPGEINVALAEQGAVLFHAKDLWAEPGNAEAPAPLGGNGSCASCHGAYSPRFVHDPAYLETPDWEGMAAHISPLDVIGTDPARSDMLTDSLRVGWDTTFWGYPEGVPGYVAPEDKDPLTEAGDDLLPDRPVGVCGWEKGVIGYQAPPLYGVWATAPYFHNGSVPTLEQVLDSTQRPAIWQRQLQQRGPVIGFDQSPERAYDFDAVGWKHAVLGCSDMPGSLLHNCGPAGDEGPSMTQLLQNLLNSTVSWAGLLNIPDPTPGAIDKRLVYDTRILGNGQQGHHFTDVLTPAERAAIIEYLKTL